MTDDEGTERDRMVETLMDWGLEWARASACKAALLAAGFGDVRALTAQRDGALTRARIAEDQVAILEERFPCKRACVHQGAPEEDCSLHGRTPAELWKMLDALRAQVADVNGAWASASRTCDRFRDLLCEVLDLDRNPGDDVLVGQVRSRAGKSGPERTVWRDFIGDAALLMLPEDTRTALASQPTPAAEGEGQPDWVTCCAHCECPPGQRTGHDDTCALGCNDEQEPT